MNHYTRWLELKEQNPGKYARDIAGLMNISEAELTSARVGHDAQRLQGEIRDILGALENVGETKCICRNEYAVHEQVGAFTNQQLSGHAGLVLNPRALDLRLFLHQWASVFYIKEATARGERQSIQFFDHHGDALLKVYATDNTDMAAWGEVLARFISAENAPLVLKAKEAVASTAQADAQTRNTVVIYTGSNGIFVGYLKLVWTLGTALNPVAATETVGVQASQELCLVAELTALSPETDTGLVPCTRKNGVFSFRTINSKEIQWFMISIGKTHRYHDVTSLDVSPSTE